MEVSESDGTELINTVEDNASRFSAYDFNKAQQARQLQCRIGQPCTAHFIHIVKNNQIPNCPITVRDIQNAEYIWGKELGSLKGRQCADIGSSRTDRGLQHTGAIDAKISACYTVC